MSSEPAIGEPFSQVYLRPSAPLKDSQRFRNRLAAYVAQNSAWNLGDLVIFLELRMGADELHSGRSQYDSLQTLIKSGNLPDVFDMITYVDRYLQSQTKSSGWFAGYRKNWRLFVQALFEQESLT